MGLQKEVCMMELGKENKMGEIFNSECGRETNLLVYDVVLELFVQETILLTVL